MKGLLILIALVMAFVAGRATSQDPNAVPMTGSTGLPSNCRAFVQYAIDSWESKEYNAADTFSSLERNCGVVGSLWDYRSD